VNRSCDYLVAATDYSFLTLENGKLTGKITATSRFALLEKTQKKSFYYFTGRESFGITVELAEERYKLG